MNLLTALLMVCLPLKTLAVTSAYGYRIHPLTGKFVFHNGVDLRASHDTVYAVLDGLVSNSEYDANLGMNIRIDHQGFTSIYGHLSQIFVMRGDQVAAGQPIGITGATGSVTGEHLHFIVKLGQQYVDPLQFLYRLLIKENHE
jgi:murein DD-endopeptidase MepM/ murein hydrolase activator NlpD